MEKVNNDCLKYLRIIYRYMKVKYNLTQGDLDMLLFLKSEGYFGKDKFEEFAQIISWDRVRFERLKKDGWIENFRTKKSHAKAIYGLTFKSKMMLDSIYKKINGEEIPVSENGNTMFRKNVKFTDKVYRNMIIKMNNDVKAKRQKRHPSLELE